ncbi:MAG: HNH endonuclease [candidate division Zixibacteria bacterium]
MTNRRNWTEEELIIAFNLYCKLPFGQFHHNNGKIIELAKILGRTPSAVSLKLSNFARLDPIHQNWGVSGMSHGSKLEKVIWDKFNDNWEELSYESEIQLAKSTGKREIDIIKDIPDLPVGRDKEATVKVRINQNFFRSMILANYRSRCAICSIPEARLLIAAHIVPWAAEPAQRMNPKNGICMCVLHEKAFDTGLIAIDDKYVIMLSNKIKKFASELAIQRGFIAYDGHHINAPDKFQPEKKFVKYHSENVFIR